MSLNEQQQRFDDNYSTFSDSMKSPWEKPIMTNLVY